MAEFKLDRFKYSWEGEWSTGTAYKRDDVVRVNGASYVCLVTHTASATFSEDLYAILPGSNPPVPQPKWATMTASRYFIGAYQLGQEYVPGDIVSNGGTLWICNTGHTSSDFAAQINKWDLFVEGLAFGGDWEASTTYGPGTIVRYNGINYKCVISHTSQNTLEDDINNWEVFFDGIDFRGSWEPLQQYRKNDLVKYGATIFRCTETHSSNATNLDDDKFTVEVFGSQYDGAWDETTYYNIGDIVRHSGFIYYATSNNVNTVPYSEHNDSTNWLLLSRSTRLIGDWSVDADYKTGDIVLRGGNLYVAVRDIGSGSLDGSSLDYLEDDTWELLVPGNKWAGNWELNTYYNINDVVYYNGSSYTCNFEHTSAYVNAPGDNGNVYQYWDVLIQTTNPSAMYQSGDLLTYGLNRNLGDIADTSTLGNARLPIGEQQQVLSVSEDLEVYWRNIVEDAETVFVSTNGDDDFDRGTYQKPFRTIRYAAEYVEDNFDPITPVIMKVSTGTFEEIAPISVPAGCAVNGDELRSTRVVASPAIDSYQNDYPYLVESLDHLQAILFDVISANPVTPQDGNTVDQVFEGQIKSRNELGKYIYDADGNHVYETGFPLSDNTGASEVVSRITDLKDYIEFRITDDGDVNPTVTGSNVLKDELNTVTIVNAGDALILNAQFVIADITAYLQNKHPDVTFDSGKIRNDIWSVIRGIARDLRYDGNYATITAAKRYVNAVNGSETADLFLMRDSTTLKDLTTAGLEGVLQPPQVFELYQRPTGGALVALDPGWGPDDERCWIVNRSPFMQSVTNFGTGCVGAKVDGALHNGGNRSMVANDFTQILSDGIGVWVTNNARAELISIFTYYCQIGYFAEDGGVIRSANGNNSYGKYGSIADGADKNEVPQTVNVYNRNNQAQVISAFAGGASDLIFLFEYGNTGETYSEAAASIVGAGDFAAVEYTDFRTGALFEARLTHLLGDSGTKGGAGYLSRQGSAQITIGATQTIRLSANDETLGVDEIAGMRLIIISGTGVGQYGYVDSFNFVNKEVTVRRESDGQYGWDHIIPGTPLAADLDLTTQYRIEPRIEVSAPSFTTSTTANLFANRTYVGLEYGNTRESFTNVQGLSKIDWVDDNGDPVTLNNIVAAVAIQVDGVFATNPEVPFTIIGKTSEVQATVTAITANTGSLLEINISGNGNSLSAGEEFSVILTAGTGDTFDDAPVKASFNIVRVGDEYTVTLADGGAGYAPGDRITISGASVGGAAITNDIVITVATVSDDSTAEILTFTYTGTGRNKRFVALTNAEYVQYSDNGTSWTETSLSFIGTYVALMSSPNGKFIALAQSTDQYSYSSTGESWSTGTLPFAAVWEDGIYADGKFVLVASDTSDILYSTDGTLWTTSQIPDDDGGLTSTISQWKFITYGKGTYLAVSGNDYATATSTDGGVTWTRHDEVLPDLSPADPWDVVSVAYGDNRFIILDSTGRTAYSFDGETWYQGGDAPTLTYTKMKYKDGVFFAIGLDGSAATTTCATTEDGLIWTERTLTNSNRYGDLTYGIFGGTGTWVLLGNAAQTNAIEHIVTGKRAKLRSDVLSGVFQDIKIWDPGSGYTTEPTITVTDPNATSEILIDIRTGTGSLGQPDFINRGSGYRTSTSTITITGDGYADIIPDENTLVVSGIETVPGPGVQIRIDSIFDLDTEDENDLFVFTGVEVTDLGDDGTGNGTKLVSFLISPALEPDYDLAHGTPATLRERYSQCRISGHDFLDIGTGNFEATNYPDVYASGNYFVALPENEVYEANGGRVYYTSTDQDGNFRTGELFAVQQATGIVTISAEFFDLDGLSELALGGVRLGGSGTVINEFSTDQSFIADSNNIVPTQRAIAAFLANRLSVGGENIEVNGLVAGRISIGGFDNVIKNVVGEYIVVPVDAAIQGTYTDEDELVRPVGIQGTIVSNMLYLRQFDDGMQ